MARLFALAALFAAAFSSVRAEPWQSGGTDIEIGTSSDYGSSSSGSSDIGILIIVSNAGGSSDNQYWNTPMMESTMTHQVTVGGEAGLVYSPDTLNAAVGDMVEFTFMSENHTATQSAFDTPCVKLAGGVDSGFMPNPNNTVSPPPTMMFQVTTTSPVWMYCRQKGHCGKGMVFSINPTAQKSQADFQAMAIQQNGTSSSGSSSSGYGSSGSSGSSGYGSSGSSGSGSSVWMSYSTTTTSSYSAATPASSSSSSSDSSGSVASGSGLTGSGEACSCSCLCAAGDFPTGSGIGAIGGMGGELSLVQPARKRHY